MQRENRLPTAGLVAVFFPVVLSAPVQAQERPEANPADVKSPDAIVGAVYDVISGPASENRDWNRFRSLFLPEARMIRTDRSEGDATYRIQTVEEFIDGAQKFIGGQEEGFWEQEVNAVTERFGDIAHIWSTYEVRLSRAAKPGADGINSFQLWYDGKRWWIVDIFWHDEREGVPVPERYRG